MTDEDIVKIKWLLIGAALLMTILLPIVRWRSGREACGVRSRLSFLFSTLIGVVALVSFPNFFHYHYEKFYHTHEMFHYALGVKYSTELGYHRLYDCTLAAAIEEGYVPKFSEVRDLSDDRFSTLHAAIERGKVCRELFGARWQSFIDDTQWFQNNMPQGEFSALYVDYGYNGSPLLTAIGKIFIHDAPISDELLRDLACIDLTLIVAFFALVFYLLGPSAFLVTTVFFSCNAIAAFRWIGTSFLRFLWFGAMGAGVLLAERYAFIAGGLLGLASLLRVFPGITLIAVLAHGCLSSIRNPHAWHELTRTHRKILTGALAMMCLVIIITSSFLGINVWHAFYLNTIKHMQIRASSIIGFETILLQVPTHYRLTFEVVTALCFLILAIGAAWVTTLWEFLALSPVLLIFTMMANYEYFVFTLIGLLGYRSKVLSLLLLIFAGVSWLVPGSIHATKGFDAYAAPLVLIVAFFILLAACWKTQLLDQA